MNVSNYPDLIINGFGGTWHLAFHFITRRRINGNGFEKESLSICGTGLITNRRLRFWELEDFGPHSFPRIDGRLAEKLVECVEQRGRMEALAFAYSLNGNLGRSKVTAMARLRKHRLFFPFAHAVALVKAQRFGCLHAQAGLIGAHDFRRSAAPQNDFV